MTDWQFLAGIPGPWSITEDGKVRQDGACPLQVWAGMRHPDFRARPGPEAVMHVLQRPLFGDEEVLITEIMEAADHPHSAGRSELLTLLGLALDDSALPPGVP
jgi:hypothetical protein